MPLRGLSEVRDQSRVLKVGVDHRQMAARHAVEGSHTPMITGGLEPGELKDQVEVVGGLTLAHEAVGLAVATLRAAVDHLPALAGLLDQPDRLHQRAAVTGPVPRQVVDVQRPEAERAVVAVVPVGVRGHRRGAMAADECGVLRCSTRAQGTNGSMATTSTEISRPFVAW